MSQLIIQTIYLTFVDSSDGLATLSLICTALNILLQVISKIALSTSHVDGKVVLDGMRDKLENINFKKENGTFSIKKAEEETVKILQEAALRNGLPLDEMFSYLRQVRLLLVCPELMFALNCCLPSTTVCPQLLLPSTNCMFSYPFQAEEAQQDPESGLIPMLAELCPELEAAAAAPARAAAAAPAARCVLFALNYCLPVSTTVCPQLLFACLNYCSPLTTVCLSQLLFALNYCLPSTTVRLSQLLFACLN